MDYVNFPKPGSPMLDYMDWDWACESGICGGDADIQLDGSTPLTKPEGGMKFFNVYSIYGESTKLEDVIKGSGVEWYFVPLAENWECNDVNEEERFALKLRQTPCYSGTGLRALITQMQSKYDVCRVTAYKPHPADADRTEVRSSDDLYNGFWRGDKLPEAAMRDALESHAMQMAAAEIDAAPPVGETCIFKMMAPVYFSCLDKKDGTPIIVERKLRCVWFGYESCIAETDNCYGDLFCDTDWAVDAAHEAWWDVCSHGLIPFIRNLELDAEDAGKVFREEDIGEGKGLITRQDINEDLFKLCDEWCPDLPDADFKDEVMQCFTEAAEELLDKLCDIVAQGGDLSDHNDRDLYCSVEMDAWECYQAFIYINDDVDDLRERLYSVGAGADMHEGNVAYWNGDLVCIDFGQCSST